MQRREFLRNLVFGTAVVLGSAASHGCGNSFTEENQEESKLEKIAKEPDKPPLCSLSDINELKVVEAKDLEFPDVTDSIMSVYNDALKRYGPGSMTVFRLMGFVDEKDVIRRYLEAKNDESFPKGIGNVFYIDKKSRIISLNQEDKIFVSLGEGIPVPEGKEYFGFNFCNKLEGRISFNMRGSSKYCLEPENPPYQVIVDLKGKKKTVFIPKEKMEVLDIKGYLLNNDGDLFLRWQVGGGSDPECVIREILFNLENRVVWYVDRKGKNSLVILTPDGKTLILYNKEKGCYSRYNTRTREEIEFFQEKPQVHYLEEHFEGELPFKYHKSPARVRISPNGEFFALESGKAKRLRETTMIKEGKEIHVLEEVTDTGIDVYDFQREKSLEIKPVLDSDKETIAFLEGIDNSGNVRTRFAGNYRYSGKRYRHE